MPSTPVGDFVALLLLEYILLEYILDIKVTFSPRLFFSIISCSISIKNHIQLEKSTLQVVTELDF